jgi:hypothetical protein
VVVTAEFIENTVFDAIKNELPSSKRIFYLLDFIY